jgi:hypothetical protein
MKGGCSRRTAYILRIRTFSFSARGQRSRYSDKPTGLTTRVFEFQYRQEIFSVHRSVPTDSGPNPASYSVGTQVLSLGKVAGA